MSFQINIHIQSLFYMKRRPLTTYIHEYIYKSIPSIQYYCAIEGANKSFFKVILIKKKYL